MAVPPSVLAYVERALPHENATPSRVRIEQTGEMWLKPGGRALRFNAEETFAVDRVAFTWRARFRPLPLEIVDSYEDGHGALVGRLFGRIPVLRQDTPELAEGEVMRYLAELPWVPQAISANRELGWRQLECGGVEVSAHGASVRLAFDADGDISGAEADARPRLEGKRLVRDPWRGHFSHYAELAGIRLPTRAAVAWELPDGPFTYWRGTVTGVEVER